MTLAPVTCTACGNPPIVRVAADSPIDPHARLCWYHNAISIVEPRYRVVLGDGQYPSRVYVARQKVGAA